MAKSKNVKLREIDRAFVMAVMFEKGILPMEKTTLDMRRALQQLPPEEARKMRRKFRKLWRKAMRQSIGTGRKADGREKGAKVTLGVGKHTPSLAEKNARKQLVFDMLWEQHIVPLISSLEKDPPPKGE